MELQMKAICEGRSTKNDVVQMNLEKYREVFVRTSQQMDVLKNVSCYLVFPRKPLRVHADAGE